ncbi:MAG: hypothetical protein ABI651_17995 [Verrucomicrobiota bacterium]
MRYGPVAGRARYRRGYAVRAAGIRATQGGVAVGGNRSGGAGGVASRLVLRGSEFKRQMLERMEGKLGEHHTVKLRRESAAARAERIIVEELAARPKSDPAKLVIAAPAQGDDADDQIHCRPSAPRHFQERQCPAARLDAAQSGGEYRNGGKIAQS